MKCSAIAAAITPRVQAIADALASADIQVTPVADARVPIWDKFVYLVAFSGFTGASRLAIGHIWKYPHVQEMFYAASREIAAIAKAEGVTISANRFETLKEYMDNIPPTTRSSLLIDLEQGKRIEVEALQGAAVRRAKKHNLPVPIVSTLYAVLKAVGGRAGQVIQLSRTGHGSTETRTPYFTIRLIPNPIASTLKLINSPTRSRRRVSKSAPAL